MAEDLPPLKAMYSLTEFAKMLGLSRKTIQHWADRGQIPITKIGRKRYVTLSGISAKYPQVWDSLVRRLVLREAISREDEVF